MTNSIKEITLKPEVTHEMRVSAIAADILKGLKKKDILDKYFAPSDDSFQIIAVPVSKGYTFNTEAWEELLKMENKLIHDPLIWTKI